MGKASTTLWWAVCIVFLLWGTLGLRSADPRVAGLLGVTAELALAVCATAVPIGILLAVALVKLNIPGRLSAIACLVATLFLPVYFHAAAWDAGFGMLGWYTLSGNPNLANTPWLSGWRAAVWIHSMAAIPWVALVVAAGLRAVEPELEEDAALHTSVWAVLVRVSLARASPAVFAAAVWVAVICTSEISVTDLYQVRTFAEEVFTQAVLGSLDLGAGTENVPATLMPVNSGDNAGDVVLNTPLHLGPYGLWIGLLVSCGLTVLALLALRGLLHRSLEPVMRQPWMARLHRGRWLAGVLVWTLLSIVIGVPLLNLGYKTGVKVTAAPEGRTRSWSASKSIGLVATAPWVYRRELGQSAMIGATAATAATIVAVPLVWSTRSRRHRPWQSWLLVLLVGLCFTLPGPILGILVIRVLNQPPDSPLSVLTWLYDDTQFAPWLVQTIRSLPVATLILWPAFASVPQSTIDSATSEGAGFWRRVIWIVLPQRAWAVIAAWLIALAVAVGELAGTFLVIRPGPTTISVRIFSLLHYGVEDRLAAICLVLCGAIAALTVIAAGLMRLARRQSAAR